MFYFWLFVAYVLGTLIGFYFGRNHGIKVGSVLTFDLFVKMGYVKYEINDAGEISLLKIDNSKR